jgi:hypothetical protein
VNVLYNKIRKASLHFNANQTTKFHTQTMVERGLTVINISAIIKVTSALNQDELRDKECNVLSIKLMK